ncbi:hypothetical protein AAG570_002209 [Ranatra chinensis]|uniref:ISXO2-like transposase domain-containing protein n=1 Tax=Ranatra chinensis TaxID=642074 RepID=A0ABD0Y6U4_9HEMI
MALTYEILMGTPRNNIHHELQVNPATITDWTHFVRETMVDYLEDHSESVGGPGMIVEVEESKFGKRKYSRGYYVEGQWVLGGIERGSGRTFLVPVHDRSSETLTECIKQWVLPGTTIYTDCWNARDRLGGEGYNYLTVKHSLHFVDPSTGTHASTVGMWQHFKHSAPGSGGGKGSFENYLAQYLFDRLVKSDDEDVYLRFLYIVRQIDWSTMTTGGSKQRNDEEIDDNSE